VGSGVISGVGPATFVVSDETKVKSEDFGMGIDVIGAEDVATTGSSKVWT